MTLEEDQTVVALLADKPSLRGPQALRLGASMEPLGPLAPDCHVVAIAFMHDTETCL